MNHKINSTEKGMSQNPPAKVSENENVEETPKRKPKLSKAKLKELKDEKTIKAFEKITRPIDCGLDVTSQKCKNVILKLIAKGYLEDTEKWTITLMRPFKF